MHLLQIIILAVTATSTIFANARQLKSKKKYEFNGDLNDLEIEGPGQSFLTDDGKVLNLRSIYERDLYNYWNTKTEGDTNGVIIPGSELSDEAERLCKKDTPELCKKYYVGGNFKGGGIVVWLKDRFKKNMKITFEMQSHTPLGLFILFFAASPKGNPKGSIFDEALPNRFGLYKQYTGGGINNYGISYSARYNGDPRGVVRMRKNVGRKELKEGRDYASEETGVWHKIKLVKRGLKIKFYIDDNLVFKYKAKNKKDMHKSGYIGFRQMETAWGKYRKMIVYHYV